MPRAPCPGVRAPPEDEVKLGRPGASEAPTPGEAKRTRAQGGREAGRGRGPGRSLEPRPCPEAGRERWEGPPSARPRPRPCPRLPIFSPLTPPRRGGPVETQALVPRASSGFVSFDSPGRAQTAIPAVNGFQVGMKRLQVQLKRPRDANRPYGAPVGASPGRPGLAQGRMLNGPH